MPTTPVTGIAAFAVDAEGVRCRELEAGLRLRGASTLKPLLFWVGAALDPFATNRVAWKQLAEPAITNSDNDATADLWSAAGEGSLLGALEARTGISWQVDVDGEHPALRVMVTAFELACAYAQFVTDQGGPARQLRGWMTEVPAEQTFGVRSVASEAIDVAEGSVAVKCGWSGHMPSCSCFSRNGPSARW